MFNKAFKTELNPTKKQEQLLLQKGNDNELTI